MKLGIRLKLKYMNIYLIFSFFLALGFRTNKYPFEKNLSTVLLLVLTLILVLNTNGKVSVKHTKKYFIWYTVFVGYCLLSSLWSYYDNSTYLYALFKDTYIPLLCILIIISVYLSRQNDKMRLLDMLIITEYIIMARLLLNTPLLEWIQTTDERLFGSGLGINYNDFTAQWTLVALIVTYFALYHNKKYFWSLSIFAIMIFISGSRKSIIILGMGFILIYLVKERRNLRKLFKAAFIGTVVCTIAIAIMFNNQFMYELVGERMLLMVQSSLQTSTQMLSNTSIDQSLHGRAVLREVAWDQFLKTPILGIGYYNFIHVNRYGLYAHNNWLELLATLGTVGFLLYYAMYLIIIKRAAKNCVGKEIYLDFSRFCICFMLLLVVMEYAQITFFRLYALIPIICVDLCMNYSRDDAIKYLQDKREDVNGKDEEPS